MINHYSSTPVSSHSAASAAHMDERPATARTTLPCLLNQSEEPVLVDTRIIRLTGANEDGCSYGCHVGLLVIQKMLPRLLPPPTKCD